MELVDQQINETKYKNDPGDREISTYFSFPMAKWRLYSDFNGGVNTGGMIEYVRMFSIVAVIILVIACVNFMNLSTARSEKRAREVGIRKTLGSLRKQLVFQFFTESIILAFLSFGFCLITIYLLLPSFNLLVDKQLSLNLNEPLFWLGALAIITFTGILAGSYPALFLSSFNPVKVLKGAFISGKKTVRPRQALIVFQFSVSILLISATLVVYQQIGMIKDRHIGYDPNNLITIIGSEDTQRNFEVIKQELLQTGLIQAVTRTMMPMTDIWWRSRAPDWEGKPDDLNMIFTGMTTDADFATTMGIAMLEGKDFSGAAADSSYMLLNRAAVEEMNLDHPVGMKLRYGDQEEFTVLGVTDNVVQLSPFEPVDPMLILFKPDNSYYISLRLKDQAQPAEALPAIEEIFKKYNPSQVFEYQFVDQEFEEKFIREKLVSKLSNLFAVLAITICCIGLAGLAAFTIEKRGLEISMRRILGASLHQILALISREFLKLVCLALLIAVPLSWWLMDRWLEHYQYRVEISIWIYAIVGLATLGLTLGVVSANTIKAALGNPMKSLRAD
jgi:ABC-type antimicrobial peptide transport system permease subunit